MRGRSARRALSAVLIGLLAATGLASRALASSPPLPKRPSAHTLHALIKAVAGVRSLRGGTVIFAGISSIDPRWAVVDVLRGVAPEQNAAAATVPSTTRQAMHQRHGKWDPATAPLGPISRSLFRRPTFRITYDGHGTEHNHQQIQQDGCPGGNIDIRGDASFAWHAVYSHVTEDELAFEGRDKVNRGSTVAGQETEDDNIPSCDPSSPPSHPVCNFTYAVASNHNVSPLGPILNLEAVPREDSSFDVHVPIPDFDVRGPAGGCTTDTSATRWPFTASTGFHTTPEALFFTSSDSHRVAIDNPDLPDHERTITSDNGSDTVDWTGMITVARDGSYTVPLRSSQ